MSLFLFKTLRKSLYWTLIIEESTVSAFCVHKKDLQCQKTAPHIYFMLHSAHGSYCEVVNALLMFMTRSLVQFPLWPSFLTAAQPLRDLVFAYWMLSATQ